MTDSTQSTQHTQPAARFSDQELVARVLAGESELYSILASRHNGRFYKVLQSILGSDAEAEDVIQEAHLRAMTHLNQFEGRSSFVTWLTRVMINEAYSRLRRRRVFQTIELVSETQERRQKEFASVACNPEQQAIQQQLRQILQTAVYSLPELYRVVFIIREIGETSTADTAARLGITEQCVKSRMLRARRLLRERIARRLPRTYRKSEACARDLS